MSMVFEVPGMSCGHCVAAITSAVTGLPGVTAVNVELARAEVRVDGTPNPAAVTAAIQEAGYDVSAAA
jgi:copper chaperone